MGVTVKNPSPMNNRLLALALFVFASPVVSSHAAIVINEIMYHPASELTTEEYIELYNTGAAAVDLSGWKITSGVRYTFPAGTAIGPGAYLVVTANPAAFHAKYPAVANYIASSGWQTVVAGLTQPNGGILSNSADHIVMVNAVGAAINDVSYADDGDWGVRRRDYFADWGHRGWNWDSPADGGPKDTPTFQTGTDPYVKSKSLELINANFSNANGQNWAASTVTNGTPGAANSVVAGDIAPVISGVAHFPLLPLHTDMVTITAKVVNDEASVPVVTLHWRVAAAVSPYTDPAFTTAVMFDDGAHGDALAGDGIYGVTIPAQANGAIVEFYFDAKDGANHTRYWPAPQLDESFNTVQTQNCLYQVDDTVYSGAEPIYRMVMKPADKAELVQINATTPAPPYAYGPGETAADQSYSHAKFNTTWISVDGTGTDLRYLTGSRNRGHGSRKRLPQCLNVAFANSEIWKKVTSLNLNTQYTHSQLFGSALFRQAGLAGPESRPVQVRWNAANAINAGPPSFGFYVGNEVQNGDFANHHFPLDSSGNIYRSQRYDFTVPANTMSEGDLTYKAPTGAQLPPDPYRTVWFKHTNSSEDNWTDLINLTQVLAKGTSDASFNTTYTPDNQTYQNAVQAVVDVDEWMRFFAVQTIVDNTETNISNGYGDDFYLYFGKTDTRAKFVPYDLDTICGQGDTVPAYNTHGLFRMINKDDAAANGPTVLNSFIKFPAFAPIYYKYLHEQLSTTFTTANFNALVDNVLNGMVAQAQIDSIKTFQNARTPYLATLVPLNIAVTTGPAVASGYPHTTTATTNLVGVANAITTRSVKVNGVTAAWSAWQAQWTANSVALVPGINKVLIQAFDGNSVETERLTYDVWYDDSSVVTASGTLAANTNWTAAAGPYRITANLIVPAGVTLTIGAGTTVYVASGATITVNGTGKIVANGTDTQRVVFAKEPTAAGNWGSLDFINTTVESQLNYVSFSDGGGTNIGGHSAQIHANNAIVFFDHLTWPASGVPAVQYISTDTASFIFQNCVFPTYPDPGPVAGRSQPELLHGLGGILAGGHGIARDCYFGHAYGFNDTWDFTGGQRVGAGAGPILQVINCIFDGASDDCLDLDSTDAWIEGNVFLHVHRDPYRTDDSRDTGSAISGGVDTSPQYSDWTIINNVFYDIDHVFLNKSQSSGGGRIAMYNNTVMHVAKEGSGSPLSDIGAFIWADDGTPPAPATVGSGLYARDNIIYDCGVLEVQYFGASYTVIGDNNILSVPWVGTSNGGNRVVDPRLNSGVLAGTPVANVSAAQARTAAQLLPDSPAIGTGLGGRNIGAWQPHGIVIAGEPIGTTNSTSAALTVGPGGTFDWAGYLPQGWGWTAYKWKLDAGAYSAEIPVTNNSPFTSLPTINLTGLSNGTHTVTVIGKNDAGYYQDDTFLYPLTSGTPAAATVSKTWTVNTAYVPPPGTANVRLNEVLAKNTETQGFPAATPTVFPDICELYNSGSASADLSGWGLTDNTAIPYKYAFPNGTTLGAGQYLVVYLSSSSSVPQPRSGFGLKDTGDTLTLTKSVAAGGGVADAVAFGAQLPDVSVGRRPSDAQWDMCVPTFGTLTGGVNPGAANVVAAQGIVPGIVINEWLTDAAVLANNDFIELYNPGTLPVNIGNCYLTNNPVEDLTASQLRQLTFLAPAGYIYFKADANPSQGPDHLAFKLTPAQGEIGFFDSAQNLIDRIIYGPQSTDVSQGRSPNGASTFTFFNQPTPGGPNPGSVGGGTGTVNLLPATQSWKYFSSATAAPANDASSRLWSATAFTDTTWVSRAQLLYLESAALTNTAGFVKEAANPNANIFAADGTTLLGFNATHPWQTYYFRTHFTYSGSLAGVTLTATLMLDDGAVIYLNGVEAARVRIDPGTVTFFTHANTNVSDAAVETISIPASSLVVGDNVIAVSVHQNSAVDQSATAGSSDITWGMKLDATVSTSSLTAGVVLNEVLADNLTLQDPDGSFSGWVELYNTTASPVNVSDMSLTDDTSDARKFVFPSGSTVPASGYLVVFCNPLVAASTTNTANMNTHFGLSAGGGGAFLFKKLAEGGGLQDSVNWGQQVPDRSIGRFPNGNGVFTLNTVTRGALNASAALGSISTVKLNEWLALPPSGAGWLELCNTGASPVLLTGNYLTDNLTNKTKHLIGPLTFIGGTGNSGNSRWLQLIADNNSGIMPNHVNFTLNPAGEALGIFSGSGVQLEAISFAAQSPGISGGRLADGAALTPSLNPTPGSANQPLSQDTDGDGIPDWWESLHGFNPNSAADAALDTDGDGQTNKAEYLAGTDPRNASDTLRAAITTNTPGQFHIQFPAQTGHSYTIQYKNLLTDAMWMHLTDIPLPGTTTVDYTDTTVGANAKRFYRVVTPQVP